MDRMAEVRALVGANVKRERLRQRMTQSELARLAGTDLRTAQRLEAGVTSRLTTIVAVADALGLPLGKVFAPPRARAM